MISAQNLLQPLSGNKIRHYLLLIFFCSLGTGEVFVASGQTFVKPEAQVVDGAKVYLHKVLQGQTLYGISKQYAIDIDLLVEANPEITQGLKVGQILKVPIEQINKKAAKKTPPLMLEDALIHIVGRKETLFAIARRYDVNVNDLLEENPFANGGINVRDSIRIPLKKVNTDPGILIPAANDTAFVHEVKKGETLYSISKKYQISIDRIKESNEGLSQGLKQGASLLIPYSQESEEDALVGVLPRKGSYRIALMLPICAEKNDSLLKESGQKDGVVYDLTRISMEFLHGFQLAIDTLRQSGLSVDLFVFDTKSDSDEVNQLLKREEMTSMDIFVGPFYKRPLEKVIAFAKPLGIHVVCPVNQRNKILLGNPHVSKALASRVVQVTYLAYRLAEQPQLDNVVVMDSKDLRDEPLKNAFLQAWKQRTAQLGKNQEVVVCAMEKYTIDALTAKLDKSTSNHIVVPSTNEVFVSDLVTRINKLHKSYGITIWGMKEELDDEKIDIAYKNRFQFHMVDQTWIDYESPGVKDFLSRYFEACGTEPGKFGFLGYDMALFYLSGLQTKGSTYLSGLSKSGHSLLHMDFDYRKTGVENGFENQFAVLLRYQDYQLLKVD